MEQRFRVRLVELRQDAEVGPGLLRGLVPRLDTFLEPFVASLQRSEQRANARTYVHGLLSDLHEKNAEAIAYLHDQERQALQKFVGQAPWDDRPLRAELACQVGAELGEADGVLVFDPSAFAKKGAESVGVQRQWCGRLGKVENCQVGVYLGYVSRREHALVDCRLYLPRQWATDRRRRRKAGVPGAVRFRTRHQLALDMLDQRGQGLPHAWIAGDDEMGRSSWFRRQLRARRESYLLAVPCNTLVRDLAPDPPPYGGRGRRARVPFVRVDRWCAALPERSWQTIEVRDGEKGPLEVQLARGLVQARTEGRPEEMPELLVVIREQQADGTFKHDYLLSDSGSVCTPVAELARVFKAEHRIEECLRRAKGEAGLADYQVRTWEGWHHHQTLALLATWFLTQETRRGKNPDARADGAAAGDGDQPAAAAAFGLGPPGAHPPCHDPSPATQRGGAVLPLERPQPLAASTV
jgi:SRSO17 transposase